MDAYDKAIEFLNQHPDKIADAWFQDGPGKSLFGWCTKSRDMVQNCGCLTMVRNGNSNSYRRVEPGLPMSDALNVEISNDERLPDFADDIKLEHLPVFAEWQRRMDDLWDRKTIPLEDF